MASKINEGTEVALPLRNIISMIAATALGTWAYFGLVERVSNLETEQTMMQADLKQNTEFRIKWPRGELGSLPADNEQFMLIEHIAGQVEKHTEQLEGGMHNKVNIDFLKDQVSKLQDDVEKLKDKVREANGH